MSRDMLRENVYSRTRNGDGVAYHHDWHAEPRAFLFPGKTTELFTLIASVVSAARTSSNATTAPPIINPTKDDPLLCNQARSERSVTGKWLHFASPPSVVRRFRSVVPPRARVPLCARCVDQT
eukprot:COSAG02_NODE_763_length_17431_cov_18.031502_13_plen_123_part_00